MRIKTIPTKSLGCWAVARTPASPTIPMAIPAAKPLKPTLNPAPKSANPLNWLYPVFPTEKKNFSSHNSFSNVLF